MHQLKRKLQREPTDSEKRYWNQRGNFLRRKQVAAEIRNIKRRIRQGREKAGDQTRLAQLKGIR